MSTLLTSYIFLVMTLTPSISPESIDKFNKETIKFIENDPNVTFERLDSVIQMSKDIEYGYGEAYALYLKGYTHKINDNSGKAFLSYLKALDLLKGIDSDRAADTKSRLFIETGSILRVHFKYDEAIKYYDEGIKLAKEYSLERWIIDISYNKGFALGEMGNLDQAINLLQETLNLAKRENSERMIVNCLNLIGLTFRDNHQYDMARSYFEQMLSYDYQKLNKYKYHGRAYHNIATTYVLSGDLTTAESFYDKALLEKKQYKNVTGLFITQIDLADVYYQTGRIDKANELASAGIAKYDQLSLSPDYYKIFDLQKKIAAARNDLAGVVAFSDQYVVENNKFLDQQKELIKIRDQFKMEILSASYFSNLQRERRIADLYTYILYGLLALAAVVVANKSWNMWRKKQLERDLQQAFNDLDDIDKVL